MARTGGQTYMQQFFLKNPYFHQNRRIFYLNILSLYCILRMRRKSKMGERIIGLTFRRGIFLKFLKQET